MERYGIVDIGSNTIVLLVYEIRDSQPVIIYHRSEAAHLIDHVHEGCMDQEGIQAAVRVLEDYTAEMDRMQVRHRFADITEPCRIANQKELVDALQAFPITIHPLSGYEEAYYDWCGMKLSWPDIRDGIAFDVGGGSTELIAFENDQCLDAMSFPLGCVRLAHLPLDTDQCRRHLAEARRQYPSLNVSRKELIGIGGTMRAAGLVAHEIYGTDVVVQVAMLKEIFAKLREKDPYVTEIMQRTVKKARQPVFLPGLHMILEIADIFAAEMILISRTNIREGFLLHCMSSEKY